MGSQKSPGGSLFPYYYKGGEIHCLKYGSFFADKDALLSLMKAEEDFITKSDRKLKVWVDFYETNLTDEVLTMFLQNINDLKNHISKLSIVGFSFFTKWKLRKLVKKTGLGFSMPVRFFSDPEEAKTWLVSE